MSSHEQGMTTLDYITLKMALEIGDWGYTSTYDVTPFRTGRGPPCTYDEQRITTSCGGWFAAKELEICFWRS